MKDKEKFVLLRKKKCYYTQKEFGDALGVTRQYVNHVENGIKKPSLKLVKSMAKLLHVSEIYLIKIFEL